MEAMDIRQERKYCSRIGFALVLVTLWATAWQFGLLWVDELLPFRMRDDVYYLLALVGHYALSLPVAYALCRRVPRTAFDRQPLGLGRLCRWLIIGLAVLILGSLLGSAASELAYRLAGRQTVSMVDEMFKMFGQFSPVLTLLIPCVLGPVCEELLFRGLVAARLARYGERPAALISALLFGLWHGNLEQFFYAFGIGLLLAYAYYRTGRLITPIVLHMLYNFFGSGLPSLLPLIPWVSLLYSLLWLIVAVVGVTLLITGRRTRVWLHGACPPSMGVVLGNAGVTLFIIVCLVQLTVNFVLI